MQPLSSLQLKSFGPVKPMVSANQPRFSGRAMTHNEAEELNEFLAEYGDQPLLTVDEERVLGETIRDFKNDLAAAMAKRWFPDVKGRAAITEPKLAQRFQIGSKELAELLHPKFLAVSDTAQQAALLGYNIIEGGSEYMIRLIPQMTMDNLKVLVPAKQVKPLYLKAKAAENAAHEMAKRNILLAVSVTKKKLKPGVGFMDLLQDAMVGMQRAVEKFEVDRGWKFATYATWWLKQAVGRPSMTDLHHISIPAHIVGKMLHYNVAFDRLHSGLGRDPSPAEIIADLAAHPIMVGKKKDRVFMLDEDEILTIQAAQRVNMRSSIEVAPRGKSGGGADDDARADFYADANQCPADAMSVFDDRREFIEFLLKGLNYREREVIKLRYGLNDERKAYTLKEIGEDILKLTRERVRQIEARGLLKLRTKVKGNASLAAKLRDLLTENVGDNLS